jgi:peptide-N4-(N-acetyl-beta-glucosaminyl)asparagine amidase
MDHPNAEERRFHAGVVELYYCDSCHRVTRFPRYNHPGKLLQTRRGRCGEWAQVS